MVVSQLASLFTVILLTIALSACSVHSFQGSMPISGSLVGKRPRTKSSSSPSALKMAQVSEQEARKGIDKVVNTLRKDSTANQELGKLEKVTNVLGFGAPTPGSLAVRFNASFKKGGFGRSAVPLPFGLGQSNKSEGRGQMVGQVKASVDMKTGKVTSCSVFRDLGYGRSFNLKV
jgi:hypothetical protein